MDELILEIPAESKGIGSAMRVTPIEVAWGLKAAKLVPVRL